MGSEARARLGLGALLAVTLLSFALVFENGDYPGPALLGMLMAAGVAIVARRLGIGARTTLLVSGILLLWYLEVIFQAHNTFYGLPTLEAARGLGRALINAYENSRIDVAPVPVRPGYVILTVAGMWLATTIGEIATFRWRRTVVASIGPIALFVLLLIVGVRSNGWFFVMLFLPALLAYWALESSHRLRSWGRWISPWDSGPDEAGAPIPGRLARQMGATCVAAALVAPLLLPGLGDGLLPWRTGLGGGGDGPGGGGAGVIDPLVSLRPRLIKQSNVEMFRVDSPAADYWRLLTLARFDGESWHTLPADSIPVDESGRIASALPGAAEPRSLTQEFTVTGLRGDSVPAAVVPQEITFEEPGGLVRYDVASADLQIDGGLFGGLTYTVRSALPDVTRADLRTAPVGDPGPAYTTLPQGIPPQVRALSDVWTEDADTPYRKALAIQERLRNEFVYSLEVPARASSEFLTDFLIQTRAGYCQQFAAAFAVVARLQGLPTRVVVGFLPGKPSGDSYVVTGTDAHAWPEIYFQGFGWVRFEPTPRADGTATPPSYAAVPAGPRLGFGDIGGRGDFLAGRAPGRFRETGPLRGAAGADPTAGEGGAAERDYRWERTFALLATVLAVLLGLFLITVPSLKQWRTRRRYGRAHDARDAAAAAFAEFEEEASELVIRRRPSESAVSYARRVAQLKGFADSEANRLARIYEAAEYGASDIGPEAAREARSLARRLRAQLWRAASWSARAARLFSPRGLALSGRP